MPIESPNNKAGKNFSAEKQEPNVIPAVEPSIDPVVKQAKEQGHGEGGRSPVSPGKSSDSSNDPTQTEDSLRNRLERLRNTPSEQQQNRDLVNNLSDGSKQPQKPQNMETMEMVPNGNQNLAKQLGTLEPSQRISSEFPNRFAHVEDGQPGITIPRQGYNRRQNALKDAGVIFPSNMMSNSDLARELQDGASSTPNQTNEPNESTNF
jgi:hypothetical protein